jgi:glycosyltransferase involved in cell wall biosynthesis
LLKVSIITVCLNSAKTIRKALDSLKNQTYENIELIIVDGVSTDETLQIVAEYKDIVTTLVSEKDNGIYDAMNKGVALATGHIVFFLNSDDAFYDTTVLDYIVKQFEQAPSIDLLYGNVIYDKNGDLTKRTYSHINKRTLEFESLCHQAVFARRTLFNNVGLFNLKFKTNADYDWLIRVFRSGAKCVWCDRIISLFSLGGMHRQNPALLVQEHKAVRLQYMSKIKLIFGDLIRRARHRWHLNFMPYPLGVGKINTNNNLSVILFSHGFQAEYELGFANGLASNGIAVTLIGSDTTLKHRLDPSVKLINLRGSQNPDRSKLKKIIGMLRYWYLCYCYILFNRKTPVHVIGMFFGNPWIAIIESWLTRILSKYYILTIHNILPHDKHNQLNAILYGWVFKAANQLIVHSKPMINQLNKDYSIDFNKIYFIEHGIDKIALSNEASREAGRDFYGIKDKYPLILIFGNLLYYKGTDIMINAFNFLAEESNARLLIVGRCRNNNLKQELKKMVNVSKYKERIIWYDGFLPENKVISTFHAADVLVMPYRNIYQSGVLFMALATGLRSVVSDVGTLKNYISKDFGVVVPVEDSLILAAAIEVLLVKPKPTQEYFENLAKPYLWKNTVKPLIDVYSKFI